MIKIAKDLSNIPKKLIKGSTLSKRRGVISQKAFPTSNINSSEKQKQNVKDYEDRFRTKDIKDSLETIYNKKCAYCEEKVIRNSVKQTDNKSTVEHYRPKSKYYWLAYSWDNLLWCCLKCNQNKDNNFEILHDKIEYDEAFNENIHSSTVIYNEREEPKIIHPEIESVIQKLTFNNGIISSTDNRVKYTIKTCGIDRDVLNESRKKILKSFLDSVNKRIVLGQDYDDIIKNLMDDIKQKQKEFIALRFWIYQNYESLLKGQI